MTGSNGARRHASFDSPCQVPLPSCATPPMACVYDSPPSTTLASPIFPFPRPLSFSPPPDPLPDPSPDRLSSASLPFPYDVPVHLLPRPPSDPAAHAARVRQDHRSEIGDISAENTPPPDDACYVSYPAPDPPTILAAAASPAPFLSRAPPPPDSSIEVETSVSDYRLNVRLPGFNRDAITLATKKRRILHVVADRWENGGGHFERRISFGYDADLAQVRAEFDGEMLRITVPRRLPPVDLWRPVPLGRTG
ncbi:hypothetical protein C0993_002194 [Termitomyces sp. T159_Od127]|nr:hypothetical protein C0993_002194 [Termitomyces sp. T159_Od127]